MMRVMLVHNDARHWGCVVLVVVAAGPTPRHKALDITGCRVRQQKT